MVRVRCNVNKEMVIRYWPVSANAGWSRLLTSQSRSSMIHRCGRGISRLRTNFRRNPGKSRFSRWCKETLARSASTKIDKIEREYENHPKSFSSKSYQLNACGNCCGIDIGLDRCARGSRISCT